MFFPVVFARSVATKRRPIAWARKRPPRKYQEQGVSALRYTVTPQGGVCCRMRSLATLDSLDSQPAAKNDKGACDSLDSQPAAKNDKGALDSLVCPGVLASSYPTSVKSSHWFDFLTLGPRPSAQDDVRGHGLCVEVTKGAIGAVADSHRLRLVRRR
jgi:hypothetical protein